jgi:hypothetical protein
MGREETHRFMGKGSVVLMRNGGGTWIPSGVNFWEPFGISFAAIVRHHDPA